MNKKAEFNLQGMLIGIATIGFFFGLMAFLIGALEGNYDSTGYDEGDISKYNTLGNLSKDVNSAYTKVDKTAIDPTWFDFISGIFNKILTPFKFMYRSFTSLTSLSGDVISELQLAKVIGDYLVTIITILVIIGLVMIKFYMGRQK